MKKLLPGLLVIIATLTAAARADDDPTGLYLAAAAGKAMVEDYSTNDLCYDLFLGWRPFRHFALEAGYINLGLHENPSGPDPVLRIDGWGGAVLGLLPLDDRTTLLARFGLHKLDTEHGFEAYEVKLASIYGVGAEWSTEGPLALRLELQGIYGIHDRHANGTYQAASLTVGALYRF
jgi:hypothetical protein